MAGRRPSATAGAILPFPRPSTAVSTAFPSLSHGRFHRLSIALPLPFPPPFHRLQVDLPAVCAWLDHARAAGRRVLSFCNLGKSRSSAVSLAYLLWRRMLDRHNGPGAVATTQEQDQRDDQPCLLCVHLISLSRLPPLRRSRSRSRRFGRQQVRVDTFAWWCCCRMEREREMASSLRLYCERLTAFWLWLRQRPGSWLGRSARRASSRWRLRRTRSSLSSARSLWTRPTGSAGGRSSTSMSACRPSRPPPSSCRPTRTGRPTK